jgi:hypothetical protein
MVAVGITSAATVGTPPINGETYPAVLYRDLKVANVSFPDIQVSFQ